MRSFFGNSSSKAFGISFADRPKAKRREMENDLLHVNQSNICLFAAIQVRDDYGSPKIPSIPFKV
jgi:hypothetical protein